MNIPMKQYILFILFIGLTTGACTCNRDRGVSEIEELENKLYADSIKGIDDSVASAVTDAYIDFANKYPDDEKTPEYIFKAAELSMGLNKSADAVKYFQKICDDYPDYGRAPVCLFLQGFVYETQLKNNVMAQKIYSGFIEKYPGHALTDDAKFSLENLGRSDEDIIRAFEEKLSTEDSAKGREEFQ